MASARRQTRLVGQWAQLEMPQEAHRGAGSHLDSGVALVADDVLEAAFVAASRGDHALAERLLRALPRRGIEHTATQIALANVEVEGHGRTDRALSRFAAIAACPDREPSHRAAAVEGRAVALLVAHGDVDEARRVARAAHLAYPDEVAGVRAGALAVCLDVLLGEVDADVEVVAGSAGLGDPVLAHVVGSAEALLRAFTGDLDGARRRVEQLDRARVGGAVPEHRIPGWAVLATDLAATVVEASGGRLAAARARAATALDVAERRGLGPLVASWPAVGEHLAMAVGDGGALDPIGWGRQPWLMGAQLAAAPASIARRLNAATARGRTAPPGPRPA